MSYLIYFMGKSATGKDTVARKVGEKLKCNTYVPYTTRPRRLGEVDGRDYYFTTHEKINELKKQNKVMESRSYNAKNELGISEVWTYATVDDEQWKKQGNFITVGTLESYKSLMEFFKNHPERNMTIIPIYITVNEIERYQRATKRVEYELHKLYYKRSDEQYDKHLYDETDRRTSADIKDFSEEKLKEAGITQNETFENDEKDKCSKRIVEYLNEKIFKKEENNKSKDDNFDGRD